jgi:hypothetical protein
MATLMPMPPIVIDHTDLMRFGNTWTNNGERLSRTPPSLQVSLENCSTRRWVKPWRQCLEVSRLSHQIRTHLLPLYRTV